MTTYRPAIPHKAWDDLVRFADKCAEEVSRRGVAQPCDKPAVAVRYDDNNEGWPYAVCAYHARKPMVPLAVHP